MPIYKMRGKKDGLQKYRVRLNYIDTMGNARQIDRVAYGLEDAKALEIQLAHEIKDENPTKKMTLKELYDEYIQAKRHEVKETSLETTINRYETYILPELQDTRVDKINASAIQKWKLALEERNLALNIKRRVYDAFKALFTYAVKMEYIGKSPFLKIGNFKNYSEAKKEVDFYTAEEFKKFKGAAYEYARKQELEHNTLHEWNYYVFFCIAFYTGPRKGEIHALQGTRTHHCWRTRV